MFPGHAYLARKRWGLPWYLLLSISINVCVQLLRIVSVFCNFREQFFKPFGVSICFWITGYFPCVVYKWFSSTCSDIDAWCFFSENYLRNEYTDGSMLWDYIDRVCRGNTFICRYSWCTLTSSDIQPGVNALPCHVKKVLDVILTSPNHTGHEFGRFDMLKLGTFLDHITSGVGYTPN